MVTSITYADIFRPREIKHAGVYDIALIISGSLLIGLSAQIAIWLPFSPVPVTGQTFAVLIIGALFGARRGSLAVLAYILEGTVGLPVFVSGRAGLPWLLGPTGGYLLGFIGAAYITGALAQKGWDRHVGTTILAMLFGNIAIYIFGLLWYSGWIGINQALLAQGLYPFIVGDILKTVLAAILLPSGWKLLRMVNLPTKEIQH